MGRAEGEESQAATWGPDASEAVPLRSRLCGHSDPGPPRASTQWLLRHQHIDPCDLVGGVGLSFGFKPTSNYVYFMVRR